MENQKEILCDPNVLGGWCREGSSVMSDYYIQDSGKKQTVTKIHSFRNPSGDGKVWTTCPDGKNLEGVDFKLWIKPFSQKK